MIGNHQLIQNVISKANIKLLKAKVWSTANENTFQESPDAKAKEIFERMDVDGNGMVTKEEFMKCCLEDENMLDLLTPR